MNDVTSFVLHFLGALVIYTLGFLHGHVDVRHRLWMTKAELLKKKLDAAPIDRPLRPLYKDVKM